MGKIKKLSNYVINKIAAGEVIERPAYAVKELIENSIDANATRIKVQIEQGGTKKIIVTDNGDGMSEEDIAMSILPHTTSKIETEEELENIKSFGFRGEALSSIVAIADVTIRSKQEEDIVGTEIQTIHGEIISKTKYGMPTGTQVVIENLFATVPARKKFLKSQQTEFRNIVDIVGNSILSHKNIEIELIHNKKQILSVTTSMTDEERIIALLGETIGANILPINYEDSYIKIHGNIGRPQVSSSSSNKMFLFVNNRRIYDSAINTAMRDAYENLLEPHRYPFGIINIVVPTELVDVNVHPRKEIVKFANASEIYNAVHTAVSSILKQHNLTYHNVSWKDSGTHAPIAKVLREEIQRDKNYQISEIKKDSDILQIHELYLIAETENGLRIIDQHAAHEAILFRRLKKMFQDKNKEKNTAQIAVPEPIHVSKSDYEVLTEYSKLFLEIGFEFNFKKKNEISILRIPKIFEGLEIEKIVEEVIEDIKNEKIFTNVNTQVLRMLSYLSCKSAIKAGKYLTQEERKKLLYLLKTEDYIYTCPHGRPVQIELTMNRLNYLFKR